MQQGFESQVLNTVFRSKRYAMLERKSRSKDLQVVS
jgi:hypothetical protein